MPAVHQAEDLFSAGHLFFRQPVLCQFREEKCCQHQVFSSFEFLPEKTIIIIRQGHPLIRIIPEGKHTGQEGANLAAESGKGPCMLFNHFAAGFETVCIRLAAAGAENIGAYGMNRIVFPSECFPDFIPVCNICGAEPLQFRFHDSSSFPPHKRQTGEIRPSDCLFS